MKKHAKGYNQMARRIDVSVPSLVTTGLKPTDMTRMEKTAETEIAMPVSKWSSRATGELNQVSRWMLR